MNLLVIGKKTAILCILLIVFVIGFVAINYDNAMDVFSITASKATKELPIYSVDRQDNIVSISFDAAWGNEDTQDIINILEKYNVKTTFFVVGSWVDNYPESVKALSDAGHEIMNHSNSHAHFNSLSVDEMMREINTCNDKIEKITGIRPHLFRAPYGEYNDTVIKTMNNMKIFTIQWDVDSLDWKDPPPSDIVKRVTTKVQSGSIVLFHNAAKNMLPALPQIIEKLQADGYTIVPISQIIYTDNYYLDNTGKQILSTQ